MYTKRTAHHIQRMHSTSIKDLWGPFTYQGRASSKIRVATEERIVVAQSGRTRSCIQYDCLSGVAPPGQDKYTALRSTHATGPGEWGQRYTKDTRQLIKHGQTNTARPCTGITPPPPPPPTRLGRAAPCRHAVSITWFIRYIQRSSQPYQFIFRSNILCARRTICVRVSLNGWEVTIMLCAYIQTEVHHRQFNASSSKCVINVVFVVLFSCYTPRSAEHVQKQSCQWQDYLPCIPRIVRAPNSLCHWDKKLHQCQRNVHRHWSRQFSIFRWAKQLNFTYWLCHLLSHDGDILFSV